MESKENKTQTLKTRWKGGEATFIMLHDCGLDVDPTISGFIPKWEYYNSQCHRTTIGISALRHVHWTSAPD